ncbi:aldo/keto reductase [Streptomyces xiamenensis]|uniref:aldo/keto reductase n=1 Tax=Streptomyces xiamenensis TaxID=408015 RepID=UPI0035DCECFF
MTTTQRVLGRSGIAVSPLGFGCWAIGGPWQDTEGLPLGWGAVDDEESVRAVRRALELGVTFFDTADCYGTGHSEEMLGRALKGRREEVVLASKWGNVFDPATGTMARDPDVSPGYVRRALTASLRRLGTDHLDLYQFHIGHAPPEVGEELREVCEELVAEGLIRAYGWSTDFPDRAKVFAAGEHCASVQLNCNVLEDAPELLALCEAEGLAAINRGPLAMGVLTGKYDSVPGGGASLSPGDIRAEPPAWLRYFKDGRLEPVWRAKFEAVRDVLTSAGRTPAQGALAWLWARSPAAVPIPGIRTVAQAEQNAAAMEFGPLTAEQLMDIERLLGRR